jgi:hypothetical protein
MFFFLHKLNYCQIGGMGFYAPYKPEQELLWLIAYRTILKPYKDVIRYIARKHLVHWVKDKLDYYFSIDFGRLYKEEEERAIHNEPLDTFVKVYNDKFDFICCTVASNLKVKRNVLLFCSNVERYRNSISYMLGMNDKLEIYNDDTLGALDLLSFTAASRTTRGMGADLIVIENYNTLNPDLFFETVIPLVQIKNVRLLCFYYALDVTLEAIQKLNGFKFY